MSRFCPICKKKLATRNPNKYCFAHVHSFAVIDIDRQDKKNREIMNKATKAYHRKKKLLTNLQVAQ